MSDPVDIGEGWYQYVDETGRAYFHNTITEVTQWEWPEELPVTGDDNDIDGAPTEDFADMYLREGDAADVADAEEIEVPAPSHHHVYQPKQQPQQQQQHYRQPEPAPEPAPANDGKSQFAEAMMMLRKQGIFDGGAAPSPEQNKSSTKSPVAARETSQFQESLKALRSQGVDGPGTSGITVQPYPRRGSASGRPVTGSVSEEPHAQVGQHVSQLQESSPHQDAPSTEEPQSPDQTESTISPELDELLAPQPQPQIPPSHPEWDTVTFQAVVFVWYETSSASRTEPLFPGVDGNLQVGPIHVSWGGLSMAAPGSSTSTTIPYENIVMWTLHLEETCLDLTLDGTFRPEQREIEWWTGSVLELRCCLSSTDATVALGNKIKEVCMKKAKETKATDLNKSRIAAAAATLSHQVNTTTPMQRRASLSRKTSGATPPQRKASASPGDPLAELKAIADESGSGDSPNQMDGYFQEGGSPATAVPEKKKKNMAQRFMSKAAKLAK